VSTKESNFSKSSYLLFFFEDFFILTLSVILVFGAVEIFTGRSSFSIVLKSYSSPVLASGSSNTISSSNSIIPSIDSSFSFYSTKLSIWFSTI
jgi:hypothetical protein